MIAYLFRVVNDTNGLRVILSPDLSYEELTDYRITEEARNSLKRLNQAYEFSLDNGTITKVEEIPEWTPEPGVETETPDWDLSDVFNGEVKEQQMFREWKALEGVE